MMKDNFKGLLMYLLFLHKIIFCKTSISFSITEMSIANITGSIIICFIVLCKACNFLISCLTEIVVNVNLYVETLDDYQF